MKFNFLFSKTAATLFAMIFAVSFTALPAHGIWVFFSPEEALEVAFPNGETVQKVSWREIRREVKKEIEATLGQRLILHLTKCFQGVSSGKVVGYACINNVIGRERPITYMVKLNHPAGDIAFYEIMVYREAIGKETGGGPFRQQFYGKTVASPLEYGGDLRNFAGATLSAVGLRNGFKRLLTVYDRYLKILPPIPAK